ncbi:PKD domain-containing protein [Candidatus Bipolaricaulota bacterium]|nr:PKD domain-containing protein [Candidatus Bipolaricaulota bacterium]
MALRRVIRLRYLTVLMIIVAPLFLSGCVLEQILDGMVNEHPHAVIEATPREGSAPLDVNFSGQYSRDDGMIVEYRWNFGDPMSTQSVLEIASTHTFNHPGTYLVKLTVIDDEGEVDSQQVAIVVTDAPPIAKASVNNEAPLPGVAVIFAATGSYDVQGDIVSYHWEFGDGETGIGETVQHTYNEGKYYVVTLTVTDEAGLMAQARLGMSVQPGQTSGGCSDGSCGDDDTPYAIITSNWSCSGAQVDEPIQFDGTASRPAIGKIITYSWDFGDGTSESGAIVTHAYNSQNTYIIKLTVIDEGGGVDTAIGSVRVNSTCY